MAHRYRKGIYTMGFLAFLILGLIAGAIAKLILPGKQGGGWIVTLILGVVGAILGGWIGGMIFGVGLNEFWSLSTWLLAIGGAIIVLLIYGLIVGRGSKVRD
ncbi:hypothetical protein GCM10007269_17080 [Microbacterium murale]|uniref:GlsB/YeaQ/YmgE family stress response membrane protein n=2 Tax=Microbacterium murale TaxID=1081040 RepID=A0ABQ1RLM3_9MICO|nr:hypothetical protein GCM10007269_17080 [Microbacterium murale]